MEGNPSMITLTLEEINSFKLNFLETVDNSNLSFSLSNRFQNLNQSMWVLLNLVITNFGSLTFKTLQLFYSLISLVFSSYAGYSSSSAPFFLLCQTLFFHFLERYKLTFDFVHRNVEYLNKYFATFLFFWN